MNKKRWLYLEMIGFLFTYFAGLILHHCYTFSEGAAWAILFTSVNQSIWEHVKIFSMPYIFWSFIELAVMRLNLKRFIVSKVLGLFLLSGCIIIFFSTYAGMVGNSHFILDVISTFVWIGLGYLLSYKINASMTKVEWLFPVAIAAFVLFLAMYLTFTVKPPHINLFQDPATQMYGILPKYVQTGEFFINKSRQ